MTIISNNIQLQKITISDQPKLMELVTRVYTPVYKHLWKGEDCNWYLNRFYSKENLRKELDEINAEYYFVIYKSQDVGILRIHYNKPLKDYPKNSNVYLHRIYLGIEVHGKGVAKALFNWVEQRAKNIGKDSIWLKCMDTQQQALRFYTKQGYEKIGTTSLDFELIKKDFNGMLIFWTTLK